jgi:hypothetical protein
MAQLPLFSFPKDWNLHPRCSSAIFYAPMKCSSSSPCVNTSDTSGVLLCSCHKFCQTHCSVKRSDDDNVFKRKLSWFGLLKPYKNLAPTSAWNSHVLRLLTHSVNCVDPNNGLSAIHGFFLFGSGDNDVELRTLLEFGIDADASYFLPTTGVNVVVDNVLHGGSALHFCVKRGFLKCVETLLDAGVQLDALTDGGKRAVDLCVDGSPMKALLVNPTSFCFQTLFICPEPDVLRSPTRLVARILCPNVFVFTPRDHLLLDSAPNFRPLIPRWEINKFEAC